ncbi:RND transporter [Pandoraea terrigena]|uniref:RND transporter n=1 Tax=Pandoraea terrigena TaxID=2508292 RepID=A0A5E4VC09_9BURK|nr:RND transporter [Pandoraea terrigena]
MNTLLMASAASLVMAGCAVQPATHPELKDSVSAVAPATWSVNVPSSGTDAKVWWHQFNDATLDNLIDTVLSDNLDLKAAAERVKQAQSLTIQKHSVLLPELDATAQVANELYKGGATDFLDVLSAQEVFLRDSDALNLASRDKALAAIALYRSLGGGWSENDTVAVHKIPGLASQ